MHDEDLRQARQALGDGRWEEARSLYASFSPQKVAEARPALLLIDLHKATSSQDSEKAEMVAERLCDCLNQLDELPGDFIRAFCPQVRPSLMPKKEIALITDVRIYQWILSLVARNMVLDYCTTDEVASLPEAEQRRMCQTAVTLDHYTYYRGDDTLTGVSSINKRANPKAFNRYKKLRYNTEMRPKLLQVYKALGVPDSLGLSALGLSDKYYIPDMDMPITPEEVKEHNKNNIIWGIFFLIMALLPAVAALLLD